MEKLYTLVGKLYVTVDDLQARLQDATTQLVRKDQEIARLRAGQEPKGVDPLIDGDRGA